MVFGERLKQHGDANSLTVYPSQVEDTQMAAVYTGAGVSPAGNARSEGSMWKRLGEEG